MRYPVVAWAKARIGQRAVGTKRTGLTLIELVVVVSVIAIVASMVLPAITGAVGDSKEGTRDAEHKAIIQAVVRFESDNPGQAPTSASATVTVRDSDGDGVIRIHVLTITGLLGMIGVLPAVDVTCGTTLTLLSSAIAECFAGIDFSQLAELLKKSPAHAGEVIESGLLTGSGVGDLDLGTADYVMPDCNAQGDTCEFYLLLTDSLIAGGLPVWSLDAAAEVFLMKEPGVYGD